MVKVTYDNPIANITLNGKKLKVFHLDNMNICK